MRNDSANPASCADSPSLPGRRECMAKVLAIVFGAVCGFVPLGAGLRVFLDPLSRKSDGVSWVKIASLETLPRDGTPRRFAVVADKVDAWNRLPKAPIGAVYLRRTDDATVQALNAVCPHAGCFVDYDFSGRRFHCPCHRSSFLLDGSLGDPKSPSPRGMDPLGVELRNGSEIWVKFENYLAGHKDRIPAA